MSLTNIWLQKAPNLTPRLAYSGVFPHFLLSILIVPFLLTTTTWIFLRGDTARQSVRPAGRAA